MFTLHGKHVDKNLTNQEQMEGFAAVYSESKLYNQ